MAGVVTNHRQMLPCQLVLACTGIAPVTTLAECCDVPLKHQHGIIVDDHLRTSVDHIYAAGDAAALWNPRTRKHELRAQWHAATAQGRVAAAVMAEHPESVSSFGVPWHMTRLGELSLLTVGDPLHELDGVTTLIDKKKAGYRVVSMRDERLVGYLSLGHIQPDGLAIKRMVDEELPIRDIASALLTGEFDARQYFSQHHAQTAHLMAVTGKLPVPETTRPFLKTPPVTETRRTTEPLLHTPLPTERDDDDPLQKRVEQLTSLRGSVTFHADKDDETERASVRARAPFSKARMDIFGVLDEFNRPMKSKEIALVLGKREVSIRKLLYRMKTSSLLEETEQGYRALVPREELTRRAENNAAQVHPQNITLFQRPLPGGKNRTRAMHGHVAQIKEMPALSVSDSQPLMLEQG